MLTFDYIKPKGLDEACNLLVTYGSQAKLLAGGTDLLVEIRDKKREFAGLRYVIDIKGIPELRVLGEDDGHLKIGACVTYRELMGSPLIKRYAPLLAEAASVVGAPQIRNRGTLGGNVVTASPAGDAIPALVALNTTLHIRNGQAEREVPLTDVFVGPYRTNLSPGDLIVYFRLPKLADGEKSCFIKLGRRKALAVSMINVAAIAKQDVQRRVVDIRIAPGSITPRPMRIRAAEELLLGKVPTRALLEEAGRITGEEMVRQSGIRASTPYKQPVVAVLVRRALEKVLELDA
ncbi:MAG: xanthine dehydrogenase family protein subunit M [Chloroflexi bacterium]|nr:xanthine dehydrogenase family protein subunit M [Chloroflexota bacterium]MCL5075854.1 xanthine dehydrogenase family protein subunit M [Chloroflexota bacterium]